MILKQQLAATVSRCREIGAKVYELDLIYIENGCLTPEQLAIHADLQTDLKLWQSINASIESLIKITQYANQLNG